MALDMNVDVGSVFSGIGTLAKDIRSAITGEISPEKKAEVELKLLELDSLIQQGQMEINKKEAENPSLFVAGWRPFIGWICGSALLYNYILMPFLDYWVQKGMPALDVGELTTILLGMLGLGAMRTYEKVRK